MKTEPEQPGGLAVRVVIDGEIWTPIASLEHAGPGDHCYELEREADGSYVLHFGDGVHGAGPPAAEGDIRFDYSSGAGNAGHRIAVRFQRGQIELNADWSESGPNAPSFLGLYHGTVVSNADPEARHRLQVQVPVVLGSLARWALPCQPKGYTGIPNPGDLVWVMFEGGDANNPVWIGTQ